MHTPGFSPASRPTSTQAIDLFRNAVAATPFDHPDQPMCLSNLSLALHAQSERTGQQADLHEATAAARDAVTTIPADHPHHPTCLSTLGNALQARFERTGHQADTNPISHGSVRTHRPWPPRTHAQLCLLVGISARCTVGQDTPNQRATSSWSRPSSTACGASTTGRPPQARSCGGVITQPFGEVDTLRQPRQRAASGSSVPRCTTRTPSGLNATHSTRSPASPNSRVASPLPSSAALLSLLRWIRRRRRESPQPLTGASPVAGRARRGRWKASPAWALR